MFSLKDKVAVVLGGTGVLCGAMAQGLAEAGAKVAVLGRSAERGELRVRSIEKAGGAAAFFAADAMKTEELKRALDQIVSKWGVPHILLNGAGGNNPKATLTPGKALSEIAIQDWADVFDLNLVGGALLPCQVFGSAMVQEKRGSIINVASMSGMIPLSRVVAYSAAKAAVINFTQFLAREWAPFKVRVNALSPGFFPAEQNRKLLMNDDGTYTERGNKIISHTPMSRFGEANELIGATLWLASDAASSFVTGTNIAVDGGFSAMSI